MTETYIRALTETNLYSIYSYYIPVTHLRGDFPIKYSFMAPAGMIAGFKEKNKGINVFIRHNRKYKDEIEYKFLFALDKQLIPPIQNDAYFYLGSMDYYGGYIHVFGIQGEGELYP